MRRREWGAIDYAVAAFWLSLVTCLGTVLALTIFGMLMTGNTRTHDALRTDEQGTKDALLKIADELRLKREQDSKIYGLSNSK